MFDLPFLILFIVVVMAVLACVHIVSILSSQREAYLVMISSPQLVQVGGMQNTDDAVQEGQYDFADPHINQQNFPTSVGAPVHDIRFQILRFSGPVSTRTVLRELHHNQLSRPTIEVATGIGKEYRYRNYSDVLVFMHEPWYRKKYEQVVIALSSVPGNRRIFLTPISPIRKRTWNTTYGFVGICSERVPVPVTTKTQREIPPIAYA